MRLRSLLPALAIVFALSACNLPSNAPRTETPTALVSETPTLSIPTATDAPIVTPSDTPPPTTTSTPTVPVAFPREVAVNCRLGPGTGWIVTSGLALGASAQIVGRSADGAWWYIVDPVNAGRNCWVASSVTSTAGNLGGIPVVEPPRASVTGVTVDVEPNALSVAGCVGPILPLQITGSIETNGPGPVTWYFETQQGGAMASQTTDFEGSGSREFSTTYTPAVTAGTYWVRLIVTNPNSIQGEARYTITCPP
ncbi:MAG TPA: hypothetical protein VK900_19730 [Anaerolineales bacterium]|nr:hypothetical protein [Anaerolineales bacterium]